VNPKEYDCVIVGAGIAGLTLANLLAGDGLQVAVIEAAERPAAVLVDPSLGVSEDATAQVRSISQAALNSWDRRVSALTPSSEALLQTVGAWPLMRGGRVAPYDCMRVWDAEGTGNIEFSAQDSGVPLLGHIVENRITVDALVRSAERQRGIDFYWGNPLSDLGGGPLASQSYRQSQAESPGKNAGLGQPSIAQESELISATLNSGEVLLTHLLVGADGARSRVRERLDFGVRAWSYEQSAIVATVALANAHDHTCYQAFLTTGPLALLPLADPNLCSIVWSLDQPLAEQHLQMDDAAFLGVLNRALGGSGLEVVASSERAGFPLRQSHAIDYVQSRVALIADAAHSIHPLAGQGINLGLKDAAVLAQEVIQAWAQGLDHGDLTVLRRYQRQRKGDNLAMMAAMEAFKRGFGSQQPWVRVARNLGLNWVNNLTPLKHWLAGHALQ